MKVDRNRASALLRDVLVHVDAGTGGRNRARLAVGLASRVGSKLSGLHVRPSVDVPHRYRPSDVEAARNSLAAKASADAKMAGRIFEEEARRAKIGSMWFEATGDVAGEVCRRARYADLVVLGQYEVQEPVERHPLPVAHSVVLRCGRPVLVVPEAASQGTFSRVVIAWDGSREAVRAVHDALPLLMLSESAQILKLVPSPGIEDRIDANDLAVHLKNHGVCVDANVLDLETVAEHARLRDELSGGRYDLVVMGAYSHPSWLEFVFGGVTQSILSSSAIPVLISH